MKQWHIESGRGPNLDTAVIIGKNGKKVNKNQISTSTKNLDLSDSSILKTQALLAEIQTLKQQVHIAKNDEETAWRARDECDAELRVIRNEMKYANNKNKQLRIESIHQQNELESMRSIVKTLQDELDFATILKISPLNQDSSNPIVEIFKAVIPELNFECPICLESWSVDRKPCVINCGHIVCEVCISTSSILNCPICRKEITSKSSHCVEYSKLVGLCIKLSKMLNNK